MGDASDAERTLAERRIREINEAWATLKSPKARQTYDETLLRRPRAARPATTPASRSPLPADADDDLVDVLPPMTAVTAGLFRHLPWVVVALVFGLIFVLTAYAGRDTDPTDQVEAPPLEVGACIVVEAGPRATEVPCSGPNEFRIAAQVAVADDCPAGTEARRLQAGPRIDCLDPA